MTEPATVDQIQTFLKFILNDLQDAVKIYNMFFTAENLRRLQEAQSKFNHRLQSRSAKFFLYESINEMAVESLWLKFVLEQKIIVNNVLTCFRDMSRLRDSFAFCFSESFMQLDSFKIGHLKVAIVYLIENVAKKSCSHCVKSKESFDECVMFLSRHEINFQQNTCTNCNVRKHKCFLTFESKTQDF